MSTHSCNELCAQSDTLHWVQKRFRNDFEPDEAKARADMIPSIAQEIKELSQALETLSNDYSVKLAGEPDAK